MHVIIQRKHSANIANDDILFHSSIIIYFTKEEMDIIREHGYRSDLHINDTIRNIAALDDPNERPYFIDSSKSIQELMNKEEKAIVELESIAHQIAQLQRFILPRGQRAPLEEKLTLPREGKRAN